MCTLLLTQMDGRKRYVNMDQVQHYEQRFMDQEELPGSILTFRDPDTFIVVAENAVEIYSMWYEYHNQPEVEPIEETDDGNE